MYVADKDNFIQYQETHAAISVLAAFIWISTAWVQMDFILPSMTKQADLGKLTSMSSVRGKESIETGLSAVLRISTSIVVKDVFYVLDASIRPQFHRYAVLKIMSIILKLKHVSCARELSINKEVSAVKKANILDIQYQVVSHALTPVL